MSANQRILSLSNFVKRHYRTIIRILVWYVGLVVVRDVFEFGEFYILATGFYFIYLVGFSPREEGELSAYSHFNENGERLYGDLDPVRAGRELTGQSLFMNQDDNHVDGVRGVLRHVNGSQRDQTSNQLGGRSNLIANDDEDADLQRALLMSLRQERETRDRSKKGL